MSEKIVEGANRTYVILAIVVASAEVGCPRLTPKRKRYKIDTVVAPLPFFSGRLSKPLPSFAKITIMSSASFLSRSHCLQQLGKSRRAFSLRLRSLSSYVNKLGLGGHKWSRMDPERYAQVIQTALDQGIRLVEAGQEGGDVALRNAIQSIINVPKDTTVMTRIGYRTLRVSDDDTKKSHLTRRWDGDVTVEKQTTERDEQAEIVHNISPPFLQDALDKCVFLQEPSQLPSAVVPMIHNPEVQINYQDENPHDALYEKLVLAFQGMEEAVAQHNIASYGVASNGLALPEQHPLYLNYQLVLQAAKDAASSVVVGSTNTQSSNLTMLQLPANLLEPRGMQVARDIVMAATHDEQAASTWPLLKVVCMRPLTWYPENNQPPISFVDYPIPTKDGIVYTNALEGPPTAYSQALNNALSHFDGTELLEEKKERQLTTEERETLEGCKLLQSILHDLDVGLERVSSFAAYEEDLYQKVIPTLYGRFEELDEESSHALQVSD